MLYLSEIRPEIQQVQALLIFKNNLKNKQAINYVFYFQGRRKDTEEFKLVMRKMKMKNMRQQEKEVQNKILQHLHSSLRMCQLLASEIVTADFF